jgi:hypothetical protein
MTKLPPAVLVFALAVLLAPRPAAASHFSFSIGIPLPFVPVAPPCAPYVYAPPYPVYGYPYGGYPYGYAPYVGPRFGPHYYGRGHYFDDPYRYGHRRPKARGYTFR